MFERVRVVRASSGYTYERAWFALSVDIRMSVALCFVPRCPVSPHVFCYLIAVEFSACFSKASSCGIDRSVAKLGFKYGISAILFRLVPGAEAARAVCPSRCRDVSPCALELGVHPSAVLRCCMSVYVCWTGGLAIV